MDWFPYDNCLRHERVNLKFFLNSSSNRHTGIPGVWTQQLYAGLWMLDSGRWTLDSGRWTLDSGRWTLDARFWILDAGLWTLDAEFWTLDATLRKQGSGH